MPMRTMHRVNGLMFQDLLRYEEEAREMSKKWTADEFRQYVAGLAGDFEASQIWETMTACGLMLVPQSDGFAQCTDAQAARDHIAGLIADLQGEHEVMAGPFDPAAWKLDVPVVHLQALLGCRIPAEGDGLSIDQLRTLLSEAKAVNEELRANWKRSESTVDLLERNARIQAKLLADTGRERDHALGLVEGLTASLKKLDAVIDFSVSAGAEDELMGISDPSAFNEAIECARAKLTSTVRPSRRPDETGEEYELRCGTMVSPQERKADQ